MSGNRGAAIVAAINGLASGSAMIMGMLSDPIWLLLAFVHFCNAIVFTLKVR